MLPRPDSPRMRSGWWNHSNQAHPDRQRWSTYPPLTHIGASPVIVRALMDQFPPPDQMLKVIPRTIPGLDNIYMVGQRSMPGASVPLA